MNKRVWTGILAGVVAALVVLAVAGIAYQAGEGHEGKSREVVTRPLGEGEVVRVVGGHDWDGGDGEGHKAGLIVFPLLTVLLVGLLVWGLRGGFHGGFAPDPQARFEEYHRRAHERAGPGPAEPTEA